MSTGLGWHQRFNTSSPGAYSCARTCRVQIARPTSYFGCGSFLDDLCSEVWHSRSLAMILCNLVVLELFLKLFLLLRGLLCRYADCADRQKQGKRQAQ